MKKSSLWLRFLLFSLIGVTILLGVTGIAYYRISSDAIKRLIEQKNEEAVEQAADFVSAYVHQLKQTSSALVKNADLHAYVLHDNESDRNQLLQLMQTILETNDELTAATVVTKSGHVLSTDQEIKMQTSDDMMQQPWYQTAIMKEGMPELTPAHKVAPDQKEDRWVISVTQEIGDANGENLAVLRLDISYAAMASYLSGLQLGKEGFSFIVDDSRQFVYHPRATVYSSKADMDSMKPYIEVKKGYVDGQVYVSQAPIAGSRWTLIGVSSLEEVEQSRQRMMYAMLAIGGAAFLLCLISIPVLTGIWLRPLRRLQAVCLAVGNGDNHIRAQEKGAAELIDLARQLNLMLDQIDALMLSIKDNEASIRRFELKALSAQINPHFLYNTLDTIVWMAEFNDSRSVVELTKSLAQYFRLALNNGHEQIRLKDELEHVRQYLFIQKQRYGTKLNYEITALSQYDEYMLPKLVLQPLVENAIYHGIKEVVRAGLIRVTVMERDGRPVIEIYDNGRGMPTQGKKERSIPIQEEKAAVRRGGVGLQNVDQRLRLQFGENYHMEIESEPECFTIIRIWLPPGHLA
ncbi:MAG: sensor histidine kinase [Eubacteriales bacterium]|nr:sensor histidine kinase [Eubacteriales bacterium]